MSYPNYKVATPTRELLRRVLAWAEDKGYKWASGHLPTKLPTDELYLYGKDTILYLEGEAWEITYDDRDLYSIWSELRPIPAQDFLSQQLGEVTPLFPIPF